MKDAVLALKVKDYDEAEEDLSAAMRSSSQCEYGFMELDLVSPLSKQNAIFSELIAISSDIVARLQQIRMMNL